MYRLNIYRSSPMESVLGYLYISHSCRIGIYIYNQKIDLKVQNLGHQKESTFFSVMFQNQVRWSEKAISEFATLLPLVPLEPFNSEEELKEAKFCWEILTPQKKSVGSPFPRNLQRSDPRVTDP